MANCARISFVLNFHFDWILSVESRGLYRNEETCNKAQIAEISRFDVSEASLQDWKPVSGQPVLKLL